MKARVKATGEIVFVEANLGYPGGYVASNGNTYLGEELEVIVDCEPDYWTRLEHQYAGMAMQGLMSNIEQVTPTKGRSYCDEIVDFSVAVAHALVEKLKEERK